MNKKFLLAFIITIIVLWVSHDLVSGFFSENTYLNNIILYLYPIFVSLALSAYYFYRKEKKVAIGIIIGGLVYYLGLWFVILWDMSVGMGCDRFFFNLLSNC